MTITPEDVWSFWFGALDADGAADAAHRERWWKKSASFDDEVRRRFGEAHAAAARGALDDWARDPRGRLALILILDQFSRNLFREDGRAFAQDGRALALAEQAVARGDERALPLDARGFLYLPYMHSEELRVQDRGIQLATAWRDAVSGASREKVDDHLDFARRHREIIRRFGRFPHRNGLLGRETTDEEREFLKTPGSSF